MSGTTIISPYTVDTTLIEDGQPEGSITPAYIRQLNDSVTGLAMSTQTSSYTLAATDRGTLVIYNSSSSGTFTIPANIFQAGTLVMVRQDGTGTLSLTNGSGLTLNIPSTLSSSLVQYGTCAIHFETTTTAVIM
jgi:hypothetical protein